MLAKNRVFTAVAVCSLAIGIGANSAIFSLADALLLRPLPVPQPDAVYNVNFGDSPAATDTVSYPDYRDFRDRNRTFSGLVAYQYAQFGYARDASAVPETQFGVMASGNFFQVLGVQPVLGRGFRPEEDQVPGRDAVVVLSHSFRVSHFSSDSAAVGSRVRLNGIDFTVIGVLPESFKNIDQFLRPAFYVPIAMQPALSPVNNLEKRDVRWLALKGRLKAGVTAAAAQADLGSIANALKRMYPFEPRGSKVRVQTELQLRAAQSPPDSALVEMLGLLALCVLLVACANVAGLLLSRATVRGREIAVRLAVGAARWRLLRQLFLENLLLALAGGAAGIAVALAGMRLFESIPTPTDVPVSFDIALDQRILVFTSIVAIASAFVFGFLPAWRSSRTDIISSLKARTDGTSRRGKLWGRSVLVSAQLALSCVLLILSAVVFVGFRSKITQGVGFRTDHVYLMTLNTEMVHYTKAQTERFYKELLDEVRASAGVRAAALSTFSPFGFDNESKPVLIEGTKIAKNGWVPQSLDASVTDGYFDVLGMLILRGREFRKTDTQTSPPVAVVNEQFAHRFWPNQDPIGKRFRIGDEKGPLVQVVGLAKQAKYLWISEPPQEFFWVPFSQDQRNNMTLMAESQAADAAVLAPVLRNVIHRLDRNMPIASARTMRDLYEQRSVKTPNIITEAVAGMGAMALVLAVIGLYGLITYTVDRRRREIGIRMAVGADPREVLQSVLRQALMLAGIGLGCGLMLGIASSQVVRSMLIFSGASASPLLFAAVLLPLVAVALMAAYAPARRASHIDPVRVLREE